MSKPTPKPAKAAKKTQRVKRSYTVTFRLNVEQVETDTSKVFDVENGIRSDLESLMGGTTPDDLVTYLAVEDVGAQEAEDE